MMYLTTKASGGEAVQLGCLVMRRIVLYNKLYNELEVHYGYYYVF